MGDNVTKWLLRHAKELEQVCSAWATPDESGHLAKVLHNIEQLRRAAAEIKRLRAALLVARECIDGHFDDACSDCRNAVATIDAALDRQTATK